LATAFQDRQSARPRRAAPPLERPDVVVECSKSGTETVAREDKMEALLAIGLMFAIWVVVIWGANYFNQNVN
jgi:hypothetical protein